MRVHAALAALCLVLAAAWPLRDALATGTVAGAGPDVVVTLWGMWWFSQEWTGPAWVGASTLPNYPFGTEGGVLAPVSSAVYALLRPLLGDAGASTALAVLVLSGLAGATAWVARGLGLDRLPALCAGIAVFVARYPHYALGETSIVGLTAVPVVIGIGAWVRGWRAGVVICAGLAALEYPYLAPLLPGLAVLRGAKERSWAWVGTGALALFVTWAGTQLVGRDQLPTFSAARIPPIVLYGRAWPVIEEVHARAELGTLVLPGLVRWSQGAQESIYATGRDYLGLTVLALGLLGWRRSWPWLLLGLLGAALATGSDWGGLPGPFAWVNLTARHVVRALTQPTRFLLLANIAFAVAAGFGVAQLGKAAPAGLVALLLDGLFGGGLSLRLPTTALPDAPCVAGLVDRNAVVVWPWDAREAPDAGLRTRLWQLRHERPGATFGVGSWSLGEGRRIDETLQRAGFRDQRRLVPLDLLRQYRYDTLIVDTQAKAPGPQGLGEPDARCPGADVYFLD